MADHTAAQDAADRAWALLTRIAPEAGARVVVSVAPAHSGPGDAVRVTVHDGGAPGSAARADSDADSPGDRLVERVEALLERRPLAGLVVTGVLDRHPAPGTVLAALALLAERHGAVVVVEATNVAHQDLLLDLVTGRWDRDAAPATGFTGASLERTLREAGLGVVARDDVVGPLHPDGGHGLAGSVLEGVLQYVRSTSGPGATTRSFVWACRPAAPSTAGAQPAPADPGMPSPFLSVVTRTQGGRLHCLAETFACLSAQTDQDFEVVVVGHRLSDDARADVQALIDDQPAPLRSRLRFVPADRPGRAAPLNEGFERARGRYVAILDDDDLPLAHWVETFHALADERPGQVLRTMCVLQDTDHVVVLGRAGVRATGPAQALHPPEFDLFEHLAANYTPNTGVAFPAAVFRELGLRFDEALTTTEDWELLVRAAALVGVHARGEVTSLYRWWTAGAESSRTVHTRDEWDANLRGVLARFDAMPILLGPGQAPVVRTILQQRNDAAGRAMELETQLGRLESDAAADRARAAAEAEALRRRSEQLAQVEAERATLLRAIGDLLESPGWRLTAPLRLPTLLLGSGRRVRLANYVDADAATLGEVLLALRSSRSWRVGRRLPRAGRDGSGAGG